LRLDSYMWLIVGMVALAIIVGGIVSLVAGGPTGVVGAVFGAIVWIMIWAGLRMSKRSDAMA